MDSQLRVVIDTNVLFAALRSRRGASYALVSRLPSTKFQPVVSVPLYFEYQDVLTRPGNMTGASSADDIKEFLRYFCSISHQQDVYFLWRPWLTDPRDEMVLEAAVASRSEYIITYNRRHYTDVQSFGISVVTPAAFLALPILEDA